MENEKQQPFTKPIIDMVKSSKWFVQAPHVTTNELGRLEYMDITSMHFKFLSGVGAHFRLRSLDTAIICCISTFSMSRGYCYLSKEKMAALVGTTPNSLYQHLGRLTKNGLIEKLPKTMGRVTLYRPGAEAKDYIAYVTSEIKKRADYKKQVKYKTTQ